MVHAAQGGKKVNGGVLLARRNAVSVAVGLAVGGYAFFPSAHAQVTVSDTGLQRSASTTLQYVAFQADGVATLGSGATISFVSNLNTANFGTGNGTLHFEGAATVASAVGTTASGSNGGNAYFAPLKLITGGATVSGAGATVTFASQLNSVAVSVSGIGTMAFNGVTTVTNLTFAAGNGTASFASTATVNGLVTTSTASTGTLAFATQANATFASAVGTSSAKLSTVRMTAGSATFQNALYVNTLNFAGHGTVSVASGSIGTVTTDTNNTGDLAITGTTSVTGTVGTTSARLNNLSTGSSATVTFSDAVFATNVTTLGTTTFSGALTATTASLGGTVTVTGALTATTVSLGNVTLSGGATVTSATILSGNTVTVADGKSISGTVQGNNNTNNSVGGTLSFLGSTTISSAIGSSVSLDAVTFAGGTANIGAKVHATTVSFTGSATGVFTASTATGSGVALKSNFKIGSGNTLNFGSGAYAHTASSIRVDAGGTLSTTVLSSSVGTGTAAIAYAASMHTTGSNILPSTAKYYINVPGTVTLVSGTYIQILDGSSGTAAIASSTNVTSNSNALTFTVVATADGTTSLTGQTAQNVDLWVLVTKSANSLVTAAGGTSTPIGGAMSALGTACLTGSCSAGAQAVNNYLESLNMRTEAGLAEATKVSATGVTLAAAITAANGAVAAGLNSVASRLASVRGDTMLADVNSVGTGIAGGDKGRDSAFWVKANGLRGKQDSYDGFAGYDVGQSGIALGADTDYGDGWRLGGAYTYSDTGVSMRDRETGTRTNVKTNQIAVYGMKEFGEMYVDAMLAYAHNKFSGTRAALQGSTGTSSYGGSQWTARIGGGYRMPMGGGNTLTPIYAIEWSDTKIDGYSESGVVVNGAAANNSYNSTTSAGFKTSLGVQYSGSDTWYGTAVRPEIHAVWTHDFGDEKKDVTGLLAGSVAFSNAGQKRALDSYTLGGGVAFLPNKTSKITVTYDYDTRKSYAGHAVNVTGRWNF